MSKLIIQTNNAPKSLAGYSQAVQAGGFIFVSGQGPFEPITGAVSGYLSKNKRVNVSEMLTQSLLLLGVR